jgi:hypothetical protein
MEAKEDFPWLPLWFRNNVWARIRTASVEVVKPDTSIAKCGQSVLCIIGAAIAHYDNLDIAVGLLKNGRYTPLQQQIGTIHGRDAH